MKNFEIEHQGKKYWVSRSCAVSAFVKGFDKNGDEYVLAITRGKASPDNIGKKCVPCGYLDGDETLLDCVVREVFEETGLKINKDKFEYIEFSDDLSNNYQNISFRYKTVILSIEKNIPYITNIEENEVDEVKWIKLDDIEKYDWAFNHLELIKTYIC
jgi:8-oxo-dGTP pyrophosphatase MutT (NUDIX family)